MFEAVTLATLIAAGPAPVKPKRCLDSAMSTGLHVPGGGFAGSAYGKKVVIGYLYRTGNKRYVFAGRTEPQVGTPLALKIVSYYVDEGFPRGDAAALVEDGPPILMWLSDSRAFLRKHALTTQPCVAPSTA